MQLFIAMIVYVVFVDLLYIFEFTMYLWIFFIMLDIEECSF